MRLSLVDFHSVARQCWADYLLSDITVADLQIELDGQEQLQLCCPLAS